MFPVKVVTDPDTSATLYNGELKVILPAIDLRIINGFLPLPPSLARYVCARDAHTHDIDVWRVGRKPRSARVPAPNPPTFCLAMLAASSGGITELECLNELWSGGGEGFLPRPLLIDPAGPEAALSAHRALFDAAASIASSSAVRLLSLQTQYCAFRITHEQLQNAFDTIEAFLSRANLPPTWLAFACEPAAAAIGPPDAASPFRVSQRLPLPSQGLAAIELHATRIDASADGILTVGIATGENRRTLGDWAVPYTVVPDGWMFLELPEIDIAPRHSAVLNAVWNTRSGRPPALSLTAWQPDPEHRVQIDGEEAAEGSLALRLHVGLPGSRRIAHPFHIGVMPQSPIGCRRARLAPSILRRFAAFPAAPESEALVRFLEESAAIELRPVNGATTVAKLPAALPPRTRRLTATIRTEDPDGPLVEYALLALGPDEKHEPFLRNGPAPAVAGGFSGWLPIHAAFATQIHLEVSEPAMTPLDLYLATRLAPGEIAQSARARWLEFVVDRVAEAMPA